MFLGDPPPGEATEDAFARDRGEDGYVHNYTRLWSWRPGLWDSFQTLRDELTGATSLSQRELALLVAAAVSEHGDAYCSFPWGTKLAAVTDDETAAQVLADAPAP